MTLLSVPDMSCGHCKASIETALAAVPGAQPVTVDLPARRLAVGGTAPVATIVAALAEIGFPATVVTTE